MPLAPPVTTTTLPVTCMRRLPLSHTAPLMPLRGTCSAQHEVEHRGIMACRAGQDKAVPDRVLEAQPPPGMEDHAEAVENAARQHAAQRQRGQRLDHGAVEHHAAPTHREIDADGDTV